MLTKISVAKKLSVSAADAWRAIAGFGRLDAWFPGIVTCMVEGAGIGAHRYMTTTDGGNITDQIVHFDPPRRRLSYERLKSPFPVSSYRGTVEVFESYDTCAVVVWSVSFESQPQVRETVARALVAGIGAGVDGMERVLSSRPDTQPGGSSD